MNNAAPLLSLFRWRKEGCPPCRLGGQILFSSLAQLDQGWFSLRGQNETIVVRAPELCFSGPKPTMYAQVILRLEKFELIDREIHCENPLDVEVHTIPSAEAPPLSSSPQQQQQWFRFLTDVAEIFERAGMIQVGTPTLVQCPGMEPVLEPVAARYRVSRHQWRECFLPTSPELSLKKLLATGYTDFFEIRPCFRAEENSPLHLTEFTMLEWYRGFSGSEILAVDLKFLLNGLRQKGWLKSPVEIQMQTMAEVIKKFTGLALTPQTSIEELWQTLAIFEISFDKSWSWNDCFHLLFLEKVESYIGKDCPEIICDFPPSQAALAKLTERGWADRMELYWQGFEIANGFAELTDPQIQRARFKDEIEERAKNEMTAVPIDEEFIQALAAGLPPTAGMALGLERLFMACQGLSRIQDLKILTI